jgi:hypothetical protein
MRIRTFIGLLFVIVVFGVPVFSSTSGELNAALTNAITRLDREASMNPEGSMLLASLIENEYGTREDELRWGMARKLSWGEITAFAYIQRTTGKSFAQMDQEDARRSFSTYAESAGMSFEKMTRSLDGFRKKAERERNSRIFDRLRASRKVHPLPDLGSGFGLFQEALDFRDLNPPRPIKSYSVPGEFGKVVP